jgi:hypothetical protein
MQYHLDYSSFFTDFISLHVFYLIILPFSCTFSPFIDSFELLSYTGIMPITFPSARVLRETTLEG